MRESLSVSVPMSVFSESMLLLAAETARVFVCVYKRERESASVSVNNVCMCVCVCVCVCECLGECVCVKEGS